MNTGKALVFFTVINAIIGSYFEITYFHTPSWIRHLYLPDIFEFGNDLKQLFRYLALVLTFVGVFKLIMLKKIELLKVFRFPIYYFMAGNLFWFITTLLSTEYSFIALTGDIRWYEYFLQAFTLAFLVLIIVHYVRNRTIPIENRHREVSNKARFFNWVIDLALIFSIGFSNLRDLADGFIFENVPYLNSNAHWFFALNIFIYYFVLEILFLQTLGKLHNGSYVIYEGSRFKSILIRTLCRFIPFEAFSFFGKSGWHDSISKTSVVVANEEEKPLIQSENTGDNT